MADKSAERVYEKRKGGLEIDAVGGEDEIEVVGYCVRDWLAPVIGRLLASN